MAFKNENDKISGFPGAVRSYEGKDEAKVLLEEECDVLVPAAFQKEINKVKSVSMGKAKC